MCGLAGYAGVRGATKRFLLTLALGQGIDSRGGDAVGFVSVTDRVAYARKLGTWTGARTRFIMAAARGSTCLMHARYATCGNKRDPKQAHPFAIERNGRTVLWGAHNGVVWDADESARYNARDYTVDSLEILHLVADDDLDLLQSLNGYGVLTWIEPSDPHTIKVVKLSEEGEISAVRLGGGGVVYASTDKILAGGIQFAGLAIESVYELDEVGQVYNVRADGITLDARKGVQLADWRTSYTSDSPDSWDRMQLAKWMAEEGYQ